MYVENGALFTFTKIGQGASKKSFPLVYKTMRVMRIISSIEVVNVWTIAGSLSVQPFLWFPLVPCGFPWLYLVIPGYTWLPSGHFIWPRLQKISANDGKNNCKCANDFTYI